MSCPFRLRLRGLSSVAHAALLNFAEGRSRSELLYRQRRAALVREAYIVATHSHCQLPRSLFFDFSSDIDKAEIGELAWPKLVRRLSPIVAGILVPVIAMISRRRIGAGCMLSARKRPSRVQQDTDRFARPNRVQSRPSNNSSVMLRPPKISTCSLSTGMISSRSVPR